MKSTVYFADEHLKEAYQKILSSPEYLWLGRAIDRTIERLEHDAFSGTQVPKRLIPVEYIQSYGIKNLWKCNLPHGWRLLYSVRKEGTCVVSIVLAWMSHTDYERIFNY